MEQANDDQRTEDALVRRGPGLVRGAARVGGCGVAGRSAPPQEKWPAHQAADEQQAPPAPQQATPAPPQGGGGADYTAELEKLAKLRDDGVITADDFEAKKKQLLGI
jgi:hypothetical protein